MLTCELQTLQLQNHNLFEAFFSDISSSHAQAALVLHKNFEGRQQMMRKLLEEVELKRILRDCGLESALFAMLTCPTQGQETAHVKKLLLSFAVSAQTMLANSPEYQPHLKLIDQFEKCWLSHPDQVQYTLNELYKTVLAKDFHLLETAQMHKGDAPKLWVSTDNDEERHVRMFHHLLKISEQIHVLPNDDQEQPLKPAENSLESRLKLFGHFHHALILMIEQNVFKKLYRSIPQEDRLIQPRDFSLDHNVKTQEAVGYLNPQSTAFTLKNRRKAIEAFAERLDKSQQDVLDIFKHHIER